MISEKDILNLIDIWEAVDYFGEDELLEEMDYDPNYCFENRDNFLLEAQHALQKLIDFDFETMNDKDVYERLLDLLCKNKLTYQQWDEFLVKHE